MRDVSHDGQQEESGVNDTIAVTKASVHTTIDDLCPMLVDLAKRIHRHPELKFEEYRAAKWLSEVAAEAGFQVEQPYAGLETAFRASRVGAREGPSIAFLAEYDALAAAGHACGHSLIGPASLGAALGLMSEMAHLPGSIHLIGTPGEEGGSGKAILVDAGVFDDVDAAMMFHPSGKTVLWKNSLARQTVLIEFFGRAAHAASRPEEGINALNATIQTFQSIDALRQHMLDSARIHGIITHGGDAPNIVPDYSASLFYVRALDDDYLNELIERVKNCAAGAALATGARVEVELQSSTRSLRTNMRLAGAFRENLEDLGWEFDEVDPTEGIGGTDMGNVSHVTAVIHPYLSIGPDDLVGHTEEFAAAADSAEGHRAMIAAAKALAGTAVDILLRPDLLEAIRAEFRSA